MTHWYISFATDEGFRGATVVEAVDAIEAVNVATSRGLNPGGEAAVLEVPPAAEGAPDLHAMKNRLVGKKEMLAMGARRVADCAEEIQARFNIESEIVCDLCNPSKSKN